jgi:hypothetical protein
VLYGKDKWWHLKDSQTSPLVISWRPVDFEDGEKILGEAVQDMSGDVGRVLRELGYEVA